jgi:molybdate transport repressor ModE-like protein
MYDWNDLRAFLAVARGGSALAASKALKVNQTTVVRRLEALEQALGLKLVERDQGGSRLTEAGRAILAEAEQVERAAEAVARTAALHNRGAVGTVRVTCSEMVANTILTPALIDFRRLYPDITVEVAITDAALDLKSGEADVAIRGTSGSPDPDLFGRKISDSVFALYCSRAYVRQHGFPARLEDLNDHLLVVGEGPVAGLPGMAWMLAQAPRAEIVVRSGSLTNLNAAIRAGLGIGPMVTTLSDPDPDLLRVSDEIEGSQATTWILTRPDLKDAPRVRAFIDFIIPHYQALRRRLEAEGAALRAQQPELVAQLLAARVSSPA